LNAGNLGDGMRRSPTIRHIFSNKVISHSVLVR